jgi:HPt (histidine-containing phosphotransfer) domain-containing protein
MREVNKENLADYAIAVHGIKGSSRSICAESIGTSAETLEKAAKKGDIDFVTANNASFIESVGKLIADITGIVNKITANILAHENPKPVKDKPDSDALFKLMAACENYDVDGADTAMEEIESFKYESDNGLTLWLRENVDMMNYSQIMEDERIRHLLSDA